MGKFVLLYTGSGTPETEEEQAEAMAAWGAWYEAMGEAITDGGNPFSASKSVTKSGISDGPVSSPAITGYTIIEADSLENAAAKAESHNGTVAYHAWCSAWCFPRPDDGA